MKPDSRADPVAFFWSEQFGHRYCVVILDRRKREWVGRGENRRWQFYCREYHSNSVRELRRMARPYVLSKHIAANCFAHVHRGGHP